MTECRVGGAKLSKIKENAISKIASEDDVKCFIFDAEGAIHREFVPEGQKVNAEFYVGVLDRLTYLLTPWSRVLLEKLTSKLCS